MLLVGGVDSRGNLLNGTWAWNGATWEEQSVAAAPPARKAASMAGDDPRGTVLLFGGIDARGGFLNDTWTWDGASWDDRTPPVFLAGRGRASLAVDPASQSLGLFGGLGLRTPDNHFWDRDGR